MEGKRTPEQVSLAQIAFTSSVCSVAGSGTVADDLSGPLQLSAHLDLPELARQFPHTLKLHKGLMLHQGRLDLEARAAREPDRRAVSCALKIEHVADELQGRTVTLEKPVSLTFDLEEIAGDIGLKNFRLTSAFMHGHGSGKMDELVLNLSLDIPKALA